MKHWNHINSNKGMVNELSDFINELENSRKIFLPNLQPANNLYIFSDYSSNKEQQLIGYSILILDEDSVNTFANTQKIFWEDYSLGTNIIEYKRLNYGPNERALIPFLQFCNLLNGLLFTVLIHKNIKSLFAAEIPKSLEDQIIVWKKKYVRENFLRLREFMLVILNGLGRQSQNVFWITDNDEIVANDLQLSTANNILKQSFDKHLNFNIGKFELKTLDIDSPDKCFEKLCSLTDLTAGGLVDFLGDYHSASIFPKADEIAKPIPHKKLKVNAITNWLSKTEKENSLKKITIKITEIDNGILNIEALRFPQIK